VRACVAGRISAHKSGRRSGTLSVLSLRCFMRGQAAEGTLYPLFQWVGRPVVTLVKVLFALFENDWLVAAITKSLLHP
jgi:hypothetical protein